MYKIDNANVMDVENTHSLIMWLKSQGDFALNTKCLIILYQYGRKIREILRRTRFFCMVH